MWQRVVLLLSLASHLTAASEAPLLLDTSFPAGAGPDNYVRALAVQADGRVLVAGSFTNFNGAPSASLVRLFPDGARDPSFAVDAIRHGDSAGYFSKLRQLPDGRILVSGSFTDLGSLQITNVALLRPDGRPDPFFKLPPILPRSAVYSSGDANEEGTIWLTGTFTNIGTLPNRRIARLSPEGQVDPEFHSPVRSDGDTLWSIVPLPGGKLLVSGAFQDPGSGSSVRLIRLLQDGSEDPGFVAEIPNGTTRLSRLVTLSDGSFVGEVSSAAYGVVLDAPYSLVKWFPDGRWDRAFKPSFQYTGSPLTAYTRVTGLWPLPAGRLVVAGTFLYVNGIQRPGLARLNSDGTTDLCFDPGLGPSSLLLAAAPDPYGGLLLGGVFQGVEGRPKPYLARVRPGSECGPSSPRFAAKAFLCNEGSRSALITVVRNGPVNEPDLVRVATHEASAHAGLDFVATNVDLAFSPGQRTATCAIPLLQDAEVEAEETVQLTLARPPGTPEVLLDQSMVVIVDQVTLQTVGLVDTNFVPRLDGPVTAGTHSRSGGWVLAVSPTNSTGQTDYAGALRRLNADGSASLGFSATNRLDGMVNVVRELEDGRLLVGGDFSWVGGFFVPGLARFGPDGQLDETYAPLAALSSTNFGARPAVTDFIVDTNSAVICSGAFPEAPGSNYRRSQVRVRPDGSLDSAFFDRTEDGPYSGGALVDLGDGSRISGVIGPSVTVARYDADGTRDPRFLPPPYTPLLATTLTVTPDQGIVAAGSAPAGLGLTGVALAKLTATGGEVHLFRENAARVFDLTNSSITRLLAEEDGRILVAGTFHRAPTETWTGVLRLNADGSWDPSFAMDSGAQPRWSGPGAATFEEAPQIRVLLRSPDGSLLVAGEFGGYNGYAQNFAVKLLPVHAQATPGFRFAHSSHSAAESAGVLQIDVLRTGDVSTRAQVAIETVPGTAKGGLDFEPLFERLSFSPGEWSKTVTVLLQENSMAQAERAFEIRLSAPSEGNVLLTPATVSVRVTDDDVNVGFTTNQLVAFESDGSIAIPIRRAGVAGGVLELEILRDSGERLGIVAFESLSDGGTLTNHFSLPILDDSALTPARTETLQLRLRSGSATFAPYATAIVQVIDNDFPASPGRSIAGEIITVLADSRGGTYVAGGFTAVYGQPRRNVARLNPDGEVDPAFNPGEGPNGPVTALSLQVDDKLVIAGDFTNIGGFGRERLARLNSDGTLDLSFDPGQGPSSSAGPPQILSVQPLPEGDLLVGGMFSGVDGHPTHGVARLLADGSVDRSFSSVLQSTIVKPGKGTQLVTNLSTITELHGLADGRVLVVGELYQRELLENLLPLGGDEDPGATEGRGDPSLSTPPIIGSPLSASALVLAADGRLDTNFAPRIARMRITAMAPVEKDRFLAGQVYQGGGFGLPTQATTNWLNLIRLRSDGTVDPEFRVRDLPFLSASSTLIRRLVPQTDGRLLFLVDAAIPQTDGLLAVQSLVGRLLPDGFWDSSFPLCRGTGRTRFAVSPRFPFLEEAGSEPRVPARGPIASFARQADGIIVVGGTFVSINSEPRLRLARLNGDGELRGRLALSFRRVTDVDVEITTPDEVPVPYVIQRSSDLRVWSPWVSNALPWVGLDFRATWVGFGERQFFRILPDSD